MSKPKKQVHLAAHFPGVNNTTVWSDPEAGSHIEFDSFKEFAQIAERGLFDFLFLAEGLRLREQGGKIYDLDVVGRPDTFTILTALAAVTEHLGLAGTINSTFNEPYEVARQFASLDWLSNGRAAWNVVTSWDGFTGENFRRGSFLPQGERYLRAKNFLAATDVLWSSWSEGDLVADKASGEFLRRIAGNFEVHDEHFDINGHFNVPRSPQGRPVQIQAGESDEGREFAASDSEVIFSRYSRYDEGKAFYEDVKSRLPKYGRERGDLLILPAATFAIGDTQEEAQEYAHEVRLQQVSPATAIKFLEQLWNTDLSDHDPDGPLPSFDPVVTDVDNLFSKGRASVRMNRNPVEVANEYRQRAEAKGLSSRELIIEVTGRQQFVGTAEYVAAEIDRYVQDDASDGFVLVSHITPGGLAPIADKVVPLLQERGVYRTEYEGATLRENLGLPPLGVHANRRATA